ncbi:hypothetical protein NPIL_422591 [Nephila pilipes]|uniref:Uncharacterized protein n=1 Tax=Nephila pilipes TaxID=299642 RepID=A0A8X6QJT0_NEPPI|nr:hypothetical protein NPIL_422591 [Nephila pilipes]
MRWIHVLAKDTSFEGRVDYDNAIGCPSNRETHRKKKGSVLGRGEHVMMFQLDIESCLHFPVIRTVIRSNLSPFHRPYQSDIDEQSLKERGQPRRCNKKMQLRLRLRPKAVLING